MDKKAVYKYTIEYSAIKKNTFESVLMRWMKLEPIIQSEVIQKELFLYLFDQTTPPILSLLLECMNNLFTVTMISESDHRI